MNTPRFFCPLPFSLHTQVDLPHDVMHHVQSVLRMQIGESLTLFNGEGGEYRAHIVLAERKRVSVEILEYSAIERESPLSIRLIQALQSGDKMDFTIQKAVELGVSLISPVTTDRSLGRLSPERAEKRLQHWKNIIIAACEQCGRNKIPVLEAIHPFSQSLGNKAPRDRLRFILLPTGTRTFNDVDAPKGAIDLLIGPEGGFTAAEIEEALQQGFQPLRLGMRVLRTETAGMAAIAAIQSLWGDFGRGEHHV